MTYSHSKCTWTIWDEANNADVLRQSWRLPGSESREAADILLLSPATFASAKEKIQLAREENPHVVTVLCHAKEKGLDAIPFLNQDLVDFVADEQPVERDLAALWAKAERLVKERRERASGLLSAKTQNRELEQLTKDLEAVVVERTSDAAASKSELEKRVTQFRDLLRFMQDLAASSSPEELARIVRKELRIYHRMGEPVLGFGLSSGDLRLVYFRNGKVFERRASRPWEQSLRLRRNDPLDSQYLANEFGRPVQKVLAIPLVARKSDPKALHPTLFLEHQMKSAEIEKFLGFIGERLQVVSVALDRLILEFDLRSATYLWEHTFDGFEDPVAIIDMDYHLLRSNRAFQLQNPESVCHQSFAKSATPCQDCPLQISLKNAETKRALVQRQGQVHAIHTYPILESAADTATTAVNHYVNVTDALSLQERMVQTEKMVALGHLAGHIAHELNNPLTGIRALAQIWLKQPGVNETVMGDLSEIERAAQRSQAIITNLLQFAKADEGDINEPVDLNEVIERTLPLLKTALSSHNLKVDLAAAPALVRADAHLLQQVLFNLLKNACQAMADRGEIHIQVEPAEFHKSAAWGLRVVDTGPGIDQAILETIFTPFFTTKAEGEGTGLGLSLSRSLVRRFGGEILVSSHLNVGTEFKVILPRAALE